MKAQKQLILAAASLVSDGGDNHEYDRALVEVTGQVLGLDLGDESVRDTILALLRVLS